MAGKSAGLIMFRRRGEQPEVLLAHPGGPFWSKKDLGAWSIPKGEYGDDEDPLEAAQREFHEETGLRPEPPNSFGADFIPLQPIRQSGGKTVTAWAVEGDCDPSAIRSNTFTMEWPPKSGRQQVFPEIDRAAWFTLAEAKQRILKGQVPLLDELEGHLRKDRGDGAL